MEKNKFKNKAGIVPENSFMNTYENFNSFNSGKGSIHESNTPIDIVHGDIEFLLEMTNPYLGEYE